MTVTADKPAPYAPPSVILEIITRYRSRGLPLPVTGEVLERAGIAVSLIPRTMQALMSLDLIDDSGNPTPVFEGLRLAPEAEYPRRLEDWLKAAYADVFAFVDPTKDDETRVRDAFRSYNPMGQQGRMVALFQGLCAAAGLISEKKNTSQPRTVSRTFSPAPRKIVGRQPITSGGYTKPPSASRSELPPALAGLLASLPANGDGWTKEARDKFLSTFGTVLDFCFPIVKHATKEAGEEAA